MKDDRRQSSYRRLVRVRKLGKVRFAAVSVLCAALITVALIGVSGTPLPAKFNPYEQIPGNEYTSGSAFSRDVDDTGDASGFAGPEAYSSAGSVDSEGSETGSARAPKREDSGQSYVKSNESRDERGRGEPDGTPASHASEGQNRNAADLADDAASKIDAAQSVDGTRGAEEARRASATTKKSSKPAKTPEGVDVPEELVPEIVAEHEPQEVLVTFSQGYSAEDLTIAIRASGCTVPQEITDDDVDIGFTTLKVDDAYDVEHAMTQLSLLPELNDAQPNFVYHLLDDASGSGASALRAALSDASALDAGSADDPLLAQATSINDEYRANLWGLESINAYRAWDTARADGEVVVAVFDNGCRISHDDLKNNIVGQYDAIHKDGEVEAGKHGTHVAGIVAAEANNGSGVAGVSYNAKLLPVQVLSASTGEGSSSTVATGFDYILKNHPEVRVINMSLGGTVDATSMDDVEVDSSDRALINAVNKAYENGILTVCSVGNDANKKGGAYLNFPSDWLDNALGVIALQKGTNGGDPTRSSSSNYNMTGQVTKDIAAPGSSIYSTGITSDNDYFYDSGTSMASPCVAGVAALVYAAKPDATAGQVADIICSSANKINASTAAYDANGFSLQYGYGEVDAEAAVLTAKGVYLRGDAEMFVGMTTQLEPKNPNDSQANGEWEWSTSDASVATVDNGMVTGVSAGSVTISAQSGNYKLTKYVTVYEAAFSGVGSMTYGSSAQLDFSAAPTGGVWNLSSADKSIVSITPALSCGGDVVRILGIGCGDTTITATLAANPALKVFYPVIVAPANIADASIYEIDNQEYTGSEVKPEPSVTFNGATLVKGKDYTLSYRNNALPCVDVESPEAPTVIIQGMGNFTGMVEVSFKICPETLSDADLSLGALSFEYNGSAQEPIVTVTHDGSLLNEGVDYVVSYANNVNAGTAQVTVKGIGDYAGTVQKSFTINKARVTPPTAERGLVYGGVPQVGVKQGAYYTLTGVSAATNAGKYKAQAALSDANNYQWIDGTSAPKTISWSIAAKSVEPKVTLSKSKLTYNGSPRKPTVTVKAGSTVLSKSDYKVVWPSNRRDVGTYKVRVVCKGNYKGSGRAAFKIKPASLAKVKVMGVPSACYYTGKPITPNVSVTLKSKKLTRGKHYTVSYVNNKRIGTATVVVKGKGNYTGTVKKAFAIIAKKWIYRC